MTARHEANVSRGGKGQDGGGGRRGGGGQPEERDTTVLPRIITSSLCG